MADALLDITVRADDVDMVVERAGAGSGVRVQQAPHPAGVHGHPDRVADALPLADGDVRVHLAGRPHCGERDRVGEDADEDRPARVRGVRDRLEIAGIAEEVRREHSQQTQRPE